MGVRAVTVKENPNILKNEISFEQRKMDIEEDYFRKKDPKRSPFTNFYQVNKENSEYLSICLAENPTALRILFFLFDHMDKYNAVMCSYKVFEEAFNLSRATVSRAIKYLKENGYVYVMKSGTTNVYIANKNLVWNSWGTNYEYCEFPANIILSKSEQEDKTKIKDKQIRTVELKK